MMKCEGKLLEVGKSLENLDFIGVLNPYMKLLMVPMEGVEPTHSHEY